MTGGYGSALTHQDGAHYYVDQTDTQHRSFTNPGSYGGTYKVGGLKDYVDGIVAEMSVSDKPDTIDEGEEVTIKDTGPFDFKEGANPNKETDEKHIDVLVFPEDSQTTVGIHPQNMNELGTTSAIVVVP